MDKKRFWESDAIETLYCVLFLFAVLGVALAPIIDYVKFNDPRYRGPETWRPVLNAPRNKKERSYLRFIKSTEFDMFIYRNKDGCFFESLNPDHKVAFPCGAFVHDDRYGCGCERAYRRMRAEIKKLRAALKKKGGS